ncbi:tetratricopeptide repeat protein [Paracidobacterium acidisoli]|uniref:Tetratricopeptide repeat protein n=1 Tax=Paracidobacterium acidisoli TaxID=2303751 RepID=A0A372IKC5_9BACT|nr:tetratricopeptide repeat protein [Paracidobacterium acidisoli]MBT9332732.1 tetratricopeptide repeat protein [Paracidobacterium acidisoli]
MRQRIFAFAFVAALAAGSSSFAAAQAASLPPGTQVEDNAQSPAAGPLAEAESSLAARDYAKAAATLDIWLSAHPDDARALFDRGYAEDAQGHTDVAATWYRKAIAADPKQFESRLALGLILAAKGDDGAREQLEAAAKLEPNPPNPDAKAQADRALARLLRNNDPEGAKNALLDALKLSPETPDDTLLTAEIAEAAGDPDTAQQAYQRVLQEQPDSSQAIAGLAHLLIAQKKYADAEPLVSSALKRDPDDPALNAQMATILAGEGKEAEAVSVLEKLHGLAPGNQSVGGMLADAYMQTGALDKADALYQQLLSAAPRDPEFLDARGQILIRQEHYAGAIAAFQKAVAAKPDDADALGGIAFAASKTAQYPLELQALSTRSKYVADTPVTLFLYATAYDNLHQTEAAADYYHRFLAAAQDKFPDQEWQARHRLIALGKK